MLARTHAYTPARTQMHGCANANTPLLDVERSRTHARTHRHSHVRMRAHIHTRMHVCVYDRTHALILTLMCAHTCTRKYTHLGRMQRGARRESSSTSKCRPLRTAASLPRSTSHRLRWALMHHACWLCPAVIFKRSVSPRLGFDTCTHACQHAAMFGHGRIDGLARPLLAGTGSRVRDAVGTGTAICNPQWHGSFKHAKHTTHEHVHACMLACWHAGMLACVCACMETRRASSCAARWHGWSCTARWNG